MELFSPDNLVALLTLTVLEIVLGIDNIIFISLVTGRLPQKDQKRARNLGLALALIFRILLLMGITIIIGFTEPLLTLFEHEFSVRDVILLAGGAFLIIKSTSEMHHKVSQVAGTAVEDSGKKRNFVNTIIQIILLDIVFSFDSILTAIGLSDKIWLMITAVVLAMFVMMFFAGAVSDFINKHPTLQILALSFLILIGFMLALESVHIEVNKGYIYFAVFFSLMVEYVNILMRKTKKAN